ncbi:MAG TPA: hypothetical protein VKD90_29750 [Gemmataceae bacterium]|nr:hypothetical protein [Gemmataceae bacterium]
MRVPALFLVACLVRPAAAEDPPAAESLFPLAIGNAWTYKVSGQDDRFVVKVAAEEAVGAQTCFKLEAWLKDKVVATEHLAFTKAGLCRFRAEHEDISPPVCILRVPVRNRPWTEKYTLGSREASYTFQALTEDVPVPAGKFKATVVRAWVGESRPPGGDIRFLRATVWYAPGVGPVKQVVAEDGKGRFPVALDLEKFEKSGGR